ncbi:hypothetical protein V6N13_083827 [Hibiscus sabdariffa]
MEEISHATKEIVRIKLSYRNLDRFTNARRSCPNHHGRGMDEFGHGRVACLTRIGNRLVKPATVMEGSATLVRVALQGDKGKPNFYDVNLVDGYKSITF